MDENKSESKSVLRHTLSISPDNPGLESDLQAQPKPPSNTIYPSTNNVSDGSTAEPEPGPMLSQHDLHGSIRLLLLRFTIGLLSIGLIGLLFGIVFNSRLISAEITGQYFGGLQDTAYLVVFVSIATLIFGAIALALKNIVYLFYPVIAFYIAGILIDKDVVHLVAGYIPLSSSTPHYLENLVAVTFSYILVHAYIWPAQIIIRSFIKHNDRTALITCCILLSLVTTMCTLIDIYSKPLLIAQERSRAIVHIPRSHELVGRAESDYSLYHKDGSSYIEAGEIITKPVPKWWSKNIHDVCGTETTSTAHPGQAPPNQYGKTTNGISFSTAVFDDNASQPALPSAAFKEYRYCFVLGYQKYLLIRNDRNINATYLQKYSSKDLIDAIAKAPTYILACTESQIFYCKPKDTDSLRKLQQNSIVTASSPQLATGVTSHGANKNAYKQTGRLTVSQWGISFPLTTDIQDAYYQPKTNDEMIVKLRSLDGNSCFDRDGVAYLMRKPISSAPTTAGSTINGQVIGTYVYSLYGNADLTFCAKAGFDQSRANALRDVFDWAEANLN